MGVSRYLRSPLIVSDSRATGTALPYHSYNFSFLAPKLKLSLEYIEKPKERTRSRAFDIEACIH